jgi:putative DNA methylase
MTSYPIRSPRKLIEVALPLDAINDAAVQEKSNPFLKGHPRSLHQWWARRPLPAARGILFGQLVNDPSWRWELEHAGEIPPNSMKASWAASRKRLFGIIEQLVKWENSTDEEILGKARSEIRKSWRETCELNSAHPEALKMFDPDKLPSLHDPFAGGGAIPLEAQRLGMNALASDLNPVAVLINKAMIEIPPRFGGKPPINPEMREEKPLIDREWRGAEGLAEDIRYYSRWIRNEAEKRMGAYYPKILITKEMTKARPDLTRLVGIQVAAVAWIWARTVKSPNPAFAHIDVPLAATFTLSTREGKEAYIYPVVESDGYRFTVKTGAPVEADAVKTGTKLARGANFRCLMSNTPISGDYIKEEGRAGRINVRLMAVVAESDRGRVYLSPTPEVEEAAGIAKPKWEPEGSFVEDARAFTPYIYGFKEWRQLFTARQLLALTTLSDLVGEVIENIRSDAEKGGMPDDGIGLDAGGSGIMAYAQAIAVYEAFALDKLADYENTLCMWNPTNQNIGHLFTKHAIPISWDFSEASPLEGGLSFDSIAEGISKAVEVLPVNSIGTAFQHDCGKALELGLFPIVSTDPPYYDNVPYADLSDFFYIWLRRSMRSVFPSLFATMAVPKIEELVATPYRHGGKDLAEKFFLDGMTAAMRRLSMESHPAAPITIYYAFKQSETATEGGTTSSGWETFLEAVLSAGLALTGTWPIRTERASRSRGIGSNALASSIVLVCRPRPEDASTTSRRAFLRELNQVLPEALDEMTKGSGDDRAPVAPVDLSQAILGPGMAVFSKYAAVLEADGTPMTVKTALTLINRFLAEDDFDHDSQFCLHWFGQYGWKEGKFGEADTLARAKGTSVDGVKQAGVLYAAGGIVRLLKWSDYPSGWEPKSDKRLPIWEALHQLIRVFKTDGETGAGKVLAAIQAKAESTRQLAYRLYTLCERAGWAEDARAYNEIVTSWSAIEIAAAAVPVEKQTSLFG